MYFLAEGERLWNEGRESERRMTPKYNLSRRDLRRWRCLEIQKQQFPGINIVKYILWHNYFGHA